MRFLATILITLLIFTFSFPVIGQASPSVSAQNAILIEKNTGRVLFEKQAHEKELIASTTKIMTALLAVESGKLDETVTVSERAVYTEGSSIYLKPGEKIKLEDLVYGLMLRSGNDAAVAISEHIGGSVEGFVHLMNEKAKWLGMTNTSFENPHGLDGEEHYSTAYDMALLMRQAMNNEHFQKITSTTSYKSESRSYSWQNKNKLLTMFYEYCTGGKTGFTKAAGRTLVSSASKDGMELIAVTFNAPDDWRDHMKMFDWGFDNYEMESIASEGEIQFKVEESDEPVVGYIHSDRLYPLTEEEKGKLDKKRFLVENKVDSGEEIIGKSIVYLDSEPITEVPIFHVEVSQEQETIFDDVISVLKRFIRLS
ncbi:D-alanyl-D-alanine carboxypeptidase [Ornithinibacillus sp. L9]|uniref:D-alanyl-D-alanine carboxypeptidase n=1 Tax=Ornithinibacillus caprae TaxID=2678566 RepID=A0A6N8FHK9_9BACI|nr:D-alanyl-D-alanine carboxypeptidase family protein [Ornithinibacillus caprae]MUK87229.1 D-alanyl-D-alanine carboxypeptidase [Ornithinibacillus caprae]